MFIFTLIIIVVGIVFSIDSFNKDGIEKAVKSALSCIVLAIASNIIWYSVVSPNLYHEDSHVGDQPSSNYADDSQNSGAFNRDEEPQNNVTQNDAIPPNKDVVSGKEEVSNDNNSPIDTVDDNQTVPKLQVCNISVPEKSIYDNPSFFKNDVSNINVSFLNYSGAIFERGQENSYEFIASESGKYRCELADMISGFTVSVYCYDSNGSKIASCTDISNGRGITVTLSAGNLYRLVVKSCTGTGNYSLFVGQQKGNMDISYCTTVTDSIEFTNQENKYFYTPSVTGTHRFWISQINSGVRVSVWIYDEAGYSVDHRTDIGIDSGVTVNLTAGQTYSVIIAQSTGCDSYTLSIGPQKPTADISTYTTITDGTEFADQTNNYVYTANTSGIHRFQIEQINSGIEVSMYVYDAAGYILGRNTYIGRNQGVTVTLDKGKTYSIVIQQETGYNSYTMSIGSPKEVVDLSGYDIVNDSIQFTDQENVYTYTPRISGVYKLSIGNIEREVKVSVYIYDDADYRLNYASGIGDTNYISASLEANQTYVIEVVHSSNYGSYSLSIALDSK